MRPEKNPKMEVENAHRDDFSFLLDFDDSSMPFRERIVKLEEKLMTLPQVDVPIRHAFCNGLYARTMFAPKRCLIVSRIYKCEQINIISSGEVSIRSEFGGGRVKGFHVFTSSVGAKRAIYCHTDVVWTTMIPSITDSIEENEKNIYAESYDDVFNDNIVLIGG